MKRSTPGHKSSFRRSVIIALAVFLLYIATLFVVRMAKSYASISHQPQAIQIINQMIMQKSDTRVLVLLLNTSEARIGGGFSGSLTTIEKDHGKLHIEPVQSVYHFDDLGVARFNEDMAAHRPIPVKEPFIRDSNQNIEWGTNAQIAADRYEYATGKHIDSVIALTPDVLKSLLVFSGPVNLPQYNKTLTADNFLEQVELEVESGTDKQQKGEPKSILGEAGTAIIDKLWDKNILQLAKLYPLLQDMVDKKFIVLWSRDSSQQKQIEQAQLSGNVRSGNFDYLFLAEGNTVANKSTPYIKQEVIKRLVINDQGEGVVSATIDRQHTSDYKDKYYDPWSKIDMYLVGENKSTIKLVLPDGAQLAKDPNSVELSPAKEGDKPYYSFVSDLVPLSHGSYSFSYKLPFRYQMGSELDVVSEVQKQVGAKPYTFQFEVQVPPEYHLVSANTDKLEYKRQDNSLVVIYTVEVDTDKVLTLKYAK